MRRMPTVPAVTSRSNSTISTHGNRHNRSTTESSSSSSQSRSRTALITTFAPPSLIGNPSFPADVFSLTTILLHLLSFVLGHSPKASASYRGKHNRLAGRGGAPPDASFHKNLPQVGTWMEQLQREAKEKERICRKAKVKGNGESALWGAVSSTIGVCKYGLRKDVSDRISAEDLEKEIRQWVDRGLGVGRRWCCERESEEVIPGTSFVSVAGTEVKSEAESEMPTKSLRTVSMASWEGQSPTERGASSANTLAPDGASIISGNREDFAKENSQRDYNSFIPEEQEDDWPLRTGHEAMPTRLMPLRS